jgi:glycosyltransferase involved in cell wall biosynthesis
VVSVVMPVFNVAPFIDEAIASVLAQTHRDFEFLIRDDGSTDGTGDALDAWARRDSRIRVFHGDRQLGPAASSNWIVRQAHYPLIARMDGDDVSHPERLQRQVALLSSRPDVSLVGTLFRTIDVNGRVVRGRDRSLLVEHHSLAPFAHGSIMYRRTAFDRVGGYRSRCDFWEDQDFYLRMSGCGRILVLPQPLFDHRFNFTSTRLVSDRDQVESAIDLGFRCLAAFAAHGHYEAVLNAGPLAQVSPRAIIAVGRLELWSYQRPAAFERLLKRSRLDWSLATVGALLWGVWAAVSPASLRRASRLWGWLRDKRAARRVQDDKVYEWPLSRIGRRAAGVLDRVMRPPSGVEEGRGDRRPLAPDSERAARLQACPPPSC